jgi:hypothetical protein
MIQVPTARGLVLCEQVIVEENTRNPTLVNCFTRLRVERVPSEPRTFFIHVLLEDGLGDVKLDVLLHRLDTDDALLARQRVARFPDRLHEVWLAFRVKDFGFPALGVYQASLLAQGAPLARARFQVLLQETAR